jgi:hypothetical protein
MNCPNCGSNGVGECEYCGSIIKAPIPEMPDLPQTSGPVNVFIDNSTNINKVTTNINGNNNYVSNSANRSTIQGGEVCDYEEYEEYEPTEVSLLGDLKANFGWILPLVGLAAGLFGVIIYLSAIRRERLARSNSEPKPSVTSISLVRTATVIPEPPTPRNEPKQPVDFEDLQPEQKAVLLKKQLAELNFVDSMRNQREEPEQEQEQEQEPSRPDADIPVRSQRQMATRYLPVVRVHTQTKTAESHPNPNRLLIRGKMEVLQKTIDKQKRIVKAIGSNSRPCSECGYAPLGTKSIAFPNSLKTEEVWYCGNCQKTYANRTIKTKYGQGKKNIPAGSFLYTPYDHRDSPSAKARQEAAYRQQSLILKDLQKQLERLSVKLNETPLLASDVPIPAPTEPKPRLFYVLQDKEVEVVSEVETGQEVVVKTPKGEFIVLKRKDIKAVVTR